MKSLAASVTNQFFIDMLGMEVPHLHKDQKKFTFSQHNVFHFAFQFMTDINPSDPKSLVASEVPGMDANKTTVLVKGSETNPSDPIDYSPNSQDLEAEAKNPQLLHHQNPHLQVVQPRSQTQLDNRPKPREII